MRLHTMALKELGNECDMDIPAEKPLRDITNILLAL